MDPMSNGAQAKAGSATYRVLRELGARAQHSFAAIREPQELVVLHRFSRGTAGGATVVDAEQMALLLRDSRCLMKHWHPNVARVRHVDLTDSELSIATELVDGVTLHDLFVAARVRAEKPNEPILPYPIVARVLVDVLGGLHGIHGLRDGISAPLGIFHGALCPTNVVIGKDGVARLINVFRPRPAAIAARSEALGYSSPESLDPEPSQDARSDLYAVGVMLWEALTGKRLYDEREPARVAQRQREEDLVKPDLAETSAFAKLGDVTMRALAFDPALRFRTASEMAAEIRRVAGTRLAPGSVVAQLVMDLLGDRVRARRAELDPLLSGTRRRSESVVDLDWAAEAVDPSPLTKRAVDATPIAARVGAELAGDAPGVAAAEQPRSLPTKKPPPKLDAVKPAPPRTVPTRPAPTSKVADKGAPRREPVKLPASPRVVAPKSEEMPKPLPPRSPPAVKTAVKPPPPLPAKPAPRTNPATTKLDTPSQVILAAARPAAPVVIAPAPISSGDLVTDLPGPRGSMIDVMDLIEEMPPSSRRLDDSDVLAAAREVSVSDRSLSNPPPSPQTPEVPAIRVEAVAALESTPHVGHVDHVAQVAVVAESGRRILAAPVVAESASHVAVAPSVVETVAPVLPVASVPASTGSAPRLEGGALAASAADSTPHEEAVPLAAVTGGGGRTQRELVVSLRPDAPSRRRFVPLVVAITTLLGLFALVAAIFSLRASSSQAGTPPGDGARTIPSVVDPPSTQVVAPPVTAPTPVVAEPQGVETAPASPSSSASAAPEPTAVANASSASTAAVKPATMPSARPVERVAAPAEAPPRAITKPKKPAYEPLGI